MLLRNLDPSKGLCNGTRLRVSEIRRKALKCRIISGDAKFAGNVVFIPKITLAPAAEDLPLPLRRRQFPVQLAFAMTVNKSQGQSLKHVGLDLQSRFFTWSIVCRIIKMHIWKQIKSCAKRGRRRQNT